MRREIDRSETETATSSRSETHRVAPPDHAAEIAPERQVMETMSFYQHAYAVIGTRLSDTSMIGINNLNALGNGLDRGVLIGHFFHLTRADDAIRMLGQTAAGTNGTSDDIATSSPSKVQIYVLADKILYAVMMVSTELPIKDGHVRSVEFYL